MVLVPHFGHPWGKVLPKTGKNNASTSSNMAELDNLMRPICFGELFSKMNEIKIRPFNVNSGYLCLILKLTTGPEHVKATKMQKRQTSVSGETVFRELS